MARICADLYYGKEDIEGVIKALEDVKTRLGRADTDPVSEAIDILQDVAGELEE